MHTCFLICPIGEDGSEIRERADILLEEVQTALAPMGFKVTRGDHHLNESRIDIDVVRSVQEADLCVADLSELNVNVYYEVGHRHETGKPIVLVKRRGSDPLPTDIATNRYTEYELETRRGAAEFRAAMQSAAEPYVGNGFESVNAATLSEVVSILQRVERKVDRLKSAMESTASPAAAMPAASIADVDGAGGLSPQEMFKVALRTQNMPMLDASLDRLQYSGMDTIKFYDYFVTVAASRGSVKAGEMTIAQARPFFDDNSVTFKMKEEYVGCLVSFLNLTDRESEQRELVESLCAEMLKDAADNDPQQVARVHNQLNRLYHGIFGNTGDTSWAMKAVDELKTALQYHDGSFIHFNLATVYRDVEDYESAADEIARCIEMDEQPDDDHLYLACRVFKKIGDPRFDDAYEELRRVNPQKVLLL